MTDDLIPDDVRDFIVRCIHSVAHLEALLLLRSNPDRYWGASEIAKRLYTSERQAAQALSEVSACGLASEDHGKYHYAPATTRLDSTASALSSAYSSHLVQVTNLIHSKPAQVHQFAQAFRFKES